MPPVPALACVRAQNKYAEPVSFEFWAHVVKMADWLCDHWRDKVGLPACSGLHPCFEIGLCGLRGLCRVRSSCTDLSRHLPPNCLASGFSNSATDHRDV